MIRLNTFKDKDILYNFFKENKIANIDYYFEYNFNNNKHYLLIENDELLGTIICYETDIKVANHFIKVSIIQDIIIKDNNHIYLDKLLLATIDYLERKELISLIKYSDKLDLSKYGFKPLYDKNIYTFDKYNFDSVDISGIKPIDKLDELVDVYAKMMRHFDGFEIRQAEYYKEYKAYLENSGSNLFGLYKNDKLLAYFSFKLNGTSTIDECVYNDLESLKKIIAYTLKYSTKTSIKVSSFEHLEKYFKEAKYIKKPYILAKVNDFELLNKVYKEDFYELYDVVKMINKPLWINYL